MQFHDDLRFLKQLYCDIWDHTDLVETDSSKSQDLHSRWTQLCNDKHGRSALKYILPVIIKLFKVRDDSKIKNATLIYILNQFDVSNTIKRIMDMDFVQLEDDQLHKQGEEMEMEQSKVLKDINLLFKYVL